MKGKFVTSIKKAVKKTSFTLKKHSPEMLMVSGIVGVVTSTVMACYSTMKLTYILEKRKKEIEEVKNKYKDIVVDKKDLDKELKPIYKKTGIDFVKLYSKPIILGVLSIGSIVGSNNILKKRNVALAAAYTAIDKGFKNYRNNVVERFGEEVDKELKYNIKSKKVKETVTDPKTGKEIEVEKEIKTASLNGDEYSVYARFYDDGCKGWTKDSEYNLMTLKAQQSYANDKLRVDGYLFLNDVYELLGIPKTKAGQVVGWIYDKENDIGDNYVDFGIYQLDKEANRDFVNGYERTILLDFNVDGYILDRANLIKN